MVTKTTSQLGQIRRDLQKPPLTYANNVGCQADRQASQRGNVVGLFWTKFGIVTATSGKLTNGRACITALLSRSYLDIEEALPSAATVADPSNKE